MDKEPKIIEISYAYPNWDMVKSIHRKYPTSEAQENLIIDSSVNWTMLLTIEYPVYMNQEQFLGFYFTSFAWMNILNVEESVKQKINLEDNKRNYSVLIIGKKAKKDKHGYRTFESPPIFIDNINYDKMISFLDLKVYETEIDTIDNWIFNPGNQKGRYTMKMFGRTIKFNTTDFIRGMVTYYELTEKLEREIFSGPLPRIYGLVTDENGKKINIMVDSNPVIQIDT